MFLRLKDPSHSTLPWWRTGPSLQKATSQAPHHLFKNPTAFPCLHVRTVAIWNVSKPVCDASPQCLKPKENWTTFFMLCCENTCCFDFQRLLFFHSTSNLEMLNFHVLWSWFSFKDIGYSSLSSPMQNSCSYTLKNLYYISIRDASECNNSFSELCARI